MTHNPIIIALDVETADQARALVAKLGDAAPFYKVGMELYAAAGMDFVRELIAEGKDVFLDQKYYDIPNTVERAVAQAAKAGVRFLTVHAQSSVMRAAAQGAAGSKLEILGVTVLTSYDQRDLDLDGYTNTTVAELVARRVRNAVDASINGIVCSPLEVKSVRAITGPGMTLVTPGVRSAGSDTADQKRVATPAQAVGDGADYLVIGRQVTRASDPHTEISKIINEINALA